MSYAHQACIYLIINTEKNCEILLQFKIMFFYFNIGYFKILFIPVIKAEFSASLLQSSVSHDPSEIILVC